MKTKRINFLQLLKGHASGWVGISDDFTSVVVSGKTLKETRRKANKLGEKVYFFPAGESYSNFVGCHSL